MSTEHEMEELQEAAEHGREHSNLAPVSFTMAFLAVLVAATLLSHRAHTEEVLLQNKATDQWGYYQAKNIRRHTMEQLDELLKVVPLKDAAGADSLIKKNEAAIDNPRATRTRFRKRPRRWKSGWICMSAAPTATMWAKLFWRSAW